MKNLIFAIVAVFALVLSGCASTQADVGAAVDGKADANVAPEKEATTDVNVDAEVSVKAKELASKISAEAQKLGTVSAAAVSEVKAALPGLEQKVGELKQELKTIGIEANADLDVALAKLADLKALLEKAAGQVEVKDITSADVAEAANEKLPGSDQTLNDALKDSLATPESANRTTAPAQQANNAVVDSKITSDNWCPAGSTIDVAAQGSTSKTLIEGLASYKGGTFCKGVSKTSIQSPIGTIEVSTDYYFNEKYSAKADGREIWVITKMPIAGQTQTTEVHLVNDQVVS